MQFSLKLPQHQLTVTFSIYTELGFRITYLDNQLSDTSLILEFPLNFLFIKKKQRVAKLDLCHGLLRGVARDTDIALIESPV